MSRPPPLVLPPLNIADIIAVRDSDRAAWSWDPSDPGTAALDTRLPTPPSPRTPSSVVSAKPVNSAEYVEDDLRSEPSSSSSRGFFVEFANEDFPLSELCDSCKYIFHARHGEDWFDKWHSFHAHWIAFQHAATNGCNVCKHLRERISSLDILGSNDGNTGIALEFKISDTLEGCSLCIGYRHVGDVSDLSQISSKNVVDNLTELRLIRVKRTHGLPKFRSRSTNLYSTQSLKTAWVGGTLLPRLSTARYGLCAEAGLPPVGLSTRGVASVK